MALVVAFVAACLRLGWWQWQRYHSPSGSLQNLGYTLQWPTFALFAIFLWWRLGRLEADRRQHRAELARQAGAEADIAIEPGPDGPPLPRPLGLDGPPQPKPHIEPARKARIASGAKPDTGPHPKQDTKPEPKPDTRPQPRPDTGPEPEAEIASGETSDGRPDDELAAYNRYLAQLHAKERNRAR